MKVIQEKVDLIKTEYKNWSGYVYYDTEAEKDAYKANLEKYLKEVYEIETKVLASDQSWIELDTGEDINDYYYFSTPDIKDKLKLSGFEDSTFELAINFKTRKVFEKTGIKIDGTKYHSQYNLSGGQKIVDETTTASTITSYTKDYKVNNYGLTAYIELDWKYQIDGQDVNVTNYEYQKSGESTWHSVTEFDEGKSAVRITESGTYIVRAAGDDSNKIENIQITLVNPPALVSDLTPKYKDGTTTTADNGEWYNYSSSVKKFAYALDTDGNTWVWIPRFAYNGSTVEFLKEASNTTTANKLLSSDYSVYYIFSSSSNNDYPNSGMSSKKTGFWISESNLSSLLSNYLKY
jgi:hypothetical protein